MYFDNGDSNGLRRCLASILSRRIRFPRSPPNFKNRFIGLSLVYVPICFLFFTRVWYMGCALAFQAIESGSSPDTRSSLFSVCGDKWTSTLFGTRNMSVRGRPHWPIILLFCYFWQHRAGLADKISYFARKIVGIVSVQSRLQPKLIWFYVAMSYHWNVDLSGSERIWIFMRAKCHWLHDWLPPSNREFDSLCPHQYLRWVYPDGLALTLKQCKDKTSKAVANLN